MSKTNHKLPHRFLLTAAIVSAASVASLSWHRVAAQSLPEVSPAELQPKWQAKQSGEVLCVAFSPDGKSLATSGQSSKVQLWDAPSGRLSKTLAGPPQIHTIWKIAFSSDGRTLASVSDKVRLWDVATERLQRSLAVANPNPFEAKHYGQGFGVSVALSPKNDTVASTGQFLTVHWQDDKANWKQVYQKKFFYGTVVAFTPDGATLIETGWNGQLNLWDVAALRNGEAKPQRELPRLQGDPWTFGKANSLSLSADGALMVVGYGYEGGILTRTSAGKLVRRRENGKVVLWDLTTGKIKRSWTVPEAAVLSVALSPDGQSVAIAGEDKQVRLWDVETGQLQHAVAGNGKVNSVAFSPDGAMLAGGGSDGVIKLWHFKK